MLWSAVSDSASEVDLAFDVDLALPLFPIAQN